MLHPPGSLLSHELLLGGKMPAGGNVVTDSQLIRMNPLIQPVMKNNRWEVPDGLTLEEFISLEDMDMAAVDEEPVRLIEKFCDAWINSSAVPNPVPKTGIRA